MTPFYTASSFFTILRTFPVCLNFHYFFKFFSMLGSEPGCIFTILYFLRNLRTGPSVRVFVTVKPFQLSVMEQSGLLGRLISYKENGELWIWYQGSFSIFSLILSHITADIQRFPYCIFTIRQNQHDLTCTLSYN